MPASNNKPHSCASTPERWRVLRVAWGWCGVRRSEAGLTRLCLPQPRREDAVAAISIGAVEADEDPLLDGVARALQEYFAGEAVVFDVPVDLGNPGTFGERVLRACERIAWGHTATYAEMAAAAGSPRGARAAGQALGRNPVPVVIPCHRVIGSDGHLVGFGRWGLAMKCQLLELEGIRVDRGKWRVDDVASGRPRRKEFDGGGL